MDLPPPLDAPSDRCERSLGRGDAEPSAGYLPGVRLFPADCSRRIWVPTPICLGGVLGSPAGCGSTLTVTSVSSATASSRSSRRMARDANAGARGRRSGGPDVDPMRDTAGRFLGRGALRVWRASGSAGSPTKSVREDKTTLFIGK